MSKVSSRLKSFYIGKKASVGMGIVLAFATPLTALALTQNSASTDTSNEQPIIVEQAPPAPLPDTTITQTETTQTTTESKSPVNISSPDISSNTSTQITVNGEAVPVQPNTSTRKVINNGNGQTVIDVSQSQTSGTSGNQGSSSTNFQSFSSSTTTTNGGTTQIITSN